MQECMDSVEANLGFRFVNMTIELIALTQRNPFSEPVGNQQLIRQRIYETGQSVGYIVAASPKWEAVLTVTSSLEDPKQFILSAKELNGIYGAKEAVADALRKIRNGQNIE